MARVADPKAMMVSVVLAPPQIATCMHNPQTQDTIRRGRPQPCHARDIYNFRVEQRRGPWLVRMVATGARVPAELLAATRKQPAAMDRHRIAAPSSPLASCGGS